MRENEFRYMVLQSLIILAHQLFRISKNLVVDRLALLDSEGDLKILEDLANRLEVAKEEAMK